MSEVRAAPAKAPTLLASRGAFVGALLVAVIVRAANLRWFAASPFADHLVLDQQAYDAWAQRIAAGDWVGTGVFWSDPLYAYVVALLYKVFGHDLAAVRAFQAALGVASVALTGSIARRISGPAVGNAAMFVAALFLPFLHNELQLEKATLTTFLVAAGLAVFLRGTPRAIAFAGVITGLGVLARGNLILLVPVAGVALLLERGDGPSIHLGRFSFARESALKSGIFVLATLLVVGTLTLRNAVVAGEFLLTTAIGGPSLYAAQRRGHDAGTYQPPDFVRSATEFEHDDFHAEAERRTGTPLTDTEVNRYWAGEAVGEMLADPLATIARSVRKLWLALHQFEVPDNDNVEVTAVYSPVLGWPVFWFGQLVPFALLGAIALWRRSRAARVTTIVAATYLAGLVAFYVMGRLRLPLAIPVIALASAGAAWWLEEARQRTGTKALHGAALVLVGLVVFAVRPGWIDDLRSGGLAVSFNNLGAQLNEGGDTQGAIAAFERAVATSPAHVVGAMRSLGDLFLQQKRYADAERLTRLVLKYKPSSPAGLAAAVTLYETMSRDPATGGLDPVRQRLAAAYRAAGRSADADRILGGAPPEPAAAPPPRPSAATLDAGALDTLTRELGAARAGSPVWIVATAVDARSVTRSQELAQAFRDAGWNVALLGTTQIAVRAGLYLFVADDAAPPYIDVAQKALDAAGLAPTLNTGYRAYYAEMVQKRADFRGFPLAPDQAYVLVVGRVP